MPYKDPEKQQVELTQLSPRKRRPGSIKPEQYDEFVVTVESCPVHGRTRASRMSNGLAYTCCGQAAGRTV